MRQGEDSAKAKREPIGKVFNYLMVYSAPIVSPQTKLRTYLCLCLCGRFKEISGAQLRFGAQSCGCIVSARMTAMNKRHNMHGTPEYSSWISMKGRCKYKGTRSYEHYGGRGISVCERWLNSFEAFYADMGNKPSPRHSLDRIDVNGNYKPSNCKWSTPSEQAFNRRKRGSGRSATQ